MRQFVPMDARRGGRLTQVRPRPSSPGKSRGRIRSAAPSPTRLSHHRDIERRRGLPLVAKLGLAGGVLVLAWFCLQVGLGLVGPAVSSLVGSFGDALGSLTHFVSAPSPSPSGLVSDAPEIEPQDPTTNVASVDITVRLPAAIVGLDGYTCRLYVTLPNAKPAIVTEAPVGAASTRVLPTVALAKGQNTFTATVVGPGGESAASKPVTVTLDVSKPKVTITAPKNGAAVKSASVTVKGKTQAASEVRIRNDANGVTASATADDTGVFSAAIAVAAGPNKLTVTVTDPAGNGNSASITVSRGAGKLSVSLSSSVYRFNSKRLPASMTLTAIVMGADGKPVAGATALFTVSVPGLPAVVSPLIHTNSAGRAKFTTSIPKGAMAGTGPATVEITMPTGTQTATDRLVLTVR